MSDNELNKTLSVIIPVHNEMQNQLFKSSVLQILEFSEVELICVDNLSEDGTLKWLNQFDIKVIKSKEKLRSKRFNIGLQESKGSLLLFHHPRSFIEKKGIQFLIENFESLCWGGFKHKFDEPNIGLKFTSWYSNHIRPKTQKIIYLDHCLFAKRSLLNKMTQPIWPETSIFEDSDFCKKLRLFNKPQILPFDSVTSAIRFKKNGFIKQSFINQVLKIGYHLDLDRHKMNQWYEKKLFLNSK
jgi:hypothetical protein